MLIARDLTRVYGDGNLLEACRRVSASTFDSCLG